MATSSSLKKAEVLKVITALPDLAAKELKRSGKFTIPGLALIKTRKKAATPAGKRTMFGKVTMVKAKPAKTVVKAFVVAGLKNQF